MKAVAVVASCCVLVFLAFYYRMFGLITGVALMLNLPCW